MAICPQCNQEIIDSGKSCPHCNTGQAPPQKKIRLTKATDDPLNGMASAKGKMVTFNLSAKLIGLIVAVVLVAGFVGGLLSGPDEETSADHGFGQDALRDKAGFTLNRTSGQEKIPVKALTEADEINTVFASLSQANLNENIDEFMQYYAASFPQRTEKLQKTLDTWSKYDFVSLDFFVFDLKVQGAHANASVGWEIALQEQGVTEPRLIETTNEVSLEKGGQGWQIVSLQ